MKHPLFLLALLLPLGAAAQTAKPQSPSLQSEAVPAAEKGETNPGHVVLRLGSFNNQNLAERHLAELAMIGVQAQIENITVNGAPIYRVRTAAVERSEARRLQELLNSNNISSYMTLAD